MKNILIAATIILFASCQKDYTLEQFQTSNPNIVNTLDAKLPTPHSLLSSAYQKQDKDRFKVMEQYSYNGGVYLGYAIYNHNGKQYEFKSGQ